MRSLIGPGQRKSIPLASVFGLLLILPTSMTLVSNPNSSVQSPTSEYGRPLSPSAIASLNCPSVDASLSYVLSTSSFQAMNPTGQYQLTQNGEQVQGQTCRRILFFAGESTTLGTIEVIINPSTPLSIYQITKSSGLQFKMMSYNNQYAGYQAQYCTSVFFGCFGTGTVTQAEMGSTVESISPASVQNADGCCAVALWTGIGDVMNASDNIFIQGGWASTDGNLGNNLWYWYDTNGGAGTTVSTGGCFQFSYGDQTSIATVWNGGSSFTVFYDNNDPNTSCSVYVNVTYSALTNPIWAYYILEDPASSGCSFLSPLNMCEIPSWSTAYPYTGYIQHGTGSVITFDSNYNPIRGEYLYQGCTANVTPSGVSSGYFTLPYSSSSQRGYQC